MFLKHQLMMPLNPEFGKRNKRPQQPIKTIDIYTHKPKGLCFFIYILNYEN
jgi:hypothetical protein